MKAILINAVTKCLEEVSVDASPQIPKLLECRVYRILSPNLGNMPLFVYTDDDMMHQEYHECKDACTLSFMPERAIFGSALVFGRNAIPYRQDCPLSFHELVDMVTFLDEQEKFAEFTRTQSMGPHLNIPTKYEEK